MSIKQSLSSLYIIAAAAALAFAPLAQASSPSSRIKNFGRINDGYYRGGQPQAGDYEYLASLGIRSVIDLERDGDAGEKQMVERAGMKFYRIAMSDRSEPTREKIEEFLKIVNDPKNQPVYVHCHAGRHRTGAMTAIYRIVHDGWPVDKAYDEMKQYEFKKGMGHGAMKSCVYEYCAEMNKEKQKSK